MINCWCRSLWKTLTISSDRRRTCRNLKCFYRSKWHNTRRCRGYRWWGWWGSGRRCRNLLDRIHLLYVFSFFCPRKQGFDDDVVVCLVRPRMGFQVHPPQKNSPLGNLTFVDPCVQDTKTGRRCLTKDLANLVTGFKSGDLGEISPFRLPRSIKYLPPPFTKTN